VISRSVSLLTDVGRVARDSSLDFVRATCGTSLGPLPDFVRATAGSFGDLVRDTFGPLPDFVRATAGWFAEVVRDTTGAAGSTVAVLGRGGTVVGRGAGCVVGGIVRGVCVRDGASVLGVRSRRPSKPSIGCDGGAAVPAAVFVRDTVGASMSTAGDAARSVGWSVIMRLRGGCVGGGGTLAGRVRVRGGITVPGGGVVSHAPYAASA
jgi:hypothetical protein